jgi:signal transduction histidine kinase
LTAAPDGPLPNLLELAAAPGTISRLVEEAVSTGQSSDTGILGLRTLTGGERRVALWLRREDDAGAVLTGLVEDHTGRDDRARELEARLAVVERERADLLHLAHHASHELQEPLRTLERFTGLLLERCRESLNGSADQYTTLISQSMDRARRLVDDLLQYSRVLNAPVRLERVDANRALALALANLQALAEESGADIRRGPLPDTLRGDPRAVVTLFQNLVGNAIKYRRGETPRVEVTAEPLEGNWRFTVRDHGMGIGEADRERIFRPFERLHSQDEIPGTGLGLALCRRIVETHGGRLWAESEPGKGSRFHFTLPATEAPA